MTTEATQAQATPVISAPEQPQSAAVLAVEPKAEDTSQESFSKRFSALNRERKQLSQKEIEIKKQMAQIETEKAEIAKWRAEQEEVKKSLNPLKALEMHGYKYEDAAQFLMNDEKPTPDLQIKSVNDKIAELQRKLEEKEQAELAAKQELLTTKQQTENKRAVEAIKTHLEAKPEFDALIALDMQGKVFEKINSHYEETGEVLNIDDVATEMLSEFEQLLEIVTKTNVYKNKYASKAESVQKSPPKTLSNSLHSQTPPADKKHYKSDSERMKNALALLGK